MPPTTKVSFTANLKPGTCFCCKFRASPIFVKVLDFGISKMRAARTQLTSALGRHGHAELHVARASYRHARRNRSAHGPVGSGLHNLGNVARSRAIRG